MLSLEDTINFGILCIYEKKGLFVCDKLKIAKEALGLMATIEEEREEA